MWNEENRPENRNRKLVSSREIKKENKQKQESERERLKVNNRTNEKQKKNMAININRDTTGKNETLRKED